MAAYNINGHCENCRYADKYGRNCEHGLLFPVGILMAYGSIYKCPNFENKTIEQLKNEKG